jgi:hypothetical protein
VTLVYVHNCTNEGCGRGSLWLVPEKSPPLDYYRDVTVSGVKIVGPTDPEVVSEVLANLTSGLAQLGYSVQVDETADD